ncbi:MAG TPA: hypothetical protein VHA11_01340 [Bryobacteraceae bacterium]|nr:hypothetical protein [Bryobacteraceae bacterium]
MKKFFAVGIFALALTAGGANAEVFVRFGPPRPPREVIVVRPSARHVWVPGYYRWAGHRYVWTRGYWVMPPRPRAVWVPGYWAPRRGGHVWIAGYWR